MGLYSIIINPHKHFLFPFAITFAYLTCTALTWYLTSQVLQVFVCSQIQPAIELPQLHRWTYNAGLQCIYDYIVSLKKINAKNKEKKKLHQHQ